MASRYVDGETDDEDGGLVAIVKAAVLDTLLKPVHIALSKAAIQAYITTLLISISAFLLFAFAVVAYVLFYWSYIPRIGFERTIHLQFDNGVPSAQALYFTGPYGVVGLTPDVVSNQRYDIAIEMLLPRTPENVDAGNFMLDVTLRAPEERGAAAGILEAVRDGVLPAGTDTTDVLARSRRPGILVYRTYLVDLAYKLTELHLYLLGMRQEAEKIRISVFEGIQFTKGWRSVPATLRLDVQSTQRMQFYGAKAHFSARFSGLRWLMYNYRMLSATVFIGVFWVTELLFAGLAWVMIAFAMNEPQKVKADEVHEVAKRVKEESPDGGRLMLSDTERTFPTLSGQAALRYQSPDIKEEPTEVHMPALPLTGIEADDEDEDADFVGDSGLGTSMESGPGRSGSVRKRRGRLGTRDGW